ncbi:MAG: hypothetical protein ABS79_02015 [Planctomycetes bacterium SCN 63-9]|nr:MAG: hypothetical protein ABS79_02015 [Planctomycetes bacterium SCN 63-9]
MSRHKLLSGCLATLPMLLCCMAGAAAPQNTTTLKHGDGKADGKQSLGGSGEMITFSLPSADAKVAGLRIHGARYGQAQAPRESFLIYFLSPDEKRILHTELAPYSLFARGPEKWVEVKFEQPVELPREFWVVVDFRAHQTKGVYVSYDKSSKGQYSRTGLPGVASMETKFGGDWLIELLLENPNPAASGTAKEKASPKKTGADAR